MYFEYVSELPEGFKKCESLYELTQLKKRKRKWRPENVELIYGLEYYVYSITSKVYYKRILEETTNLEKLKMYFKDGNLFIKAQDNE